MRSTYASLLYSLKSVYRRKAKNIYAILGIALGVSLLLGVQVSVDSVEQSWLDGSIYSIGKRHVQVFGTANPILPEIFYTTYLENTLETSSSHVQSVTARLSWKGTLLFMNQGCKECFLLCPLTDSFWGYIGLKIPI